MPGDQEFQVYSRRRQTDGDPRVAKTELLLQSSNHKRIDYTAREEIGPAANLKHYVVIFDPKEDEAKLVEVTSMALRGVVRTHQLTEEQMHRAPKKVCSPPWLRSRYY